MRFARQYFTQRAFQVVLFVQKPSKCGSVVSVWRTLQPERERATEREAGSESHVSLCLLAATYMVVVLPPTLDSMATANKTSNSSSSECTVIVIILSPGLSLLLSLLPFMFRNRLTTFHSFLLMLNTSKRCLDASSVAPPNPKFSAATSANELQIRPLYTISAWKSL